MLILFQNFIQKGILLLYVSSLWCCRSTCIILLKFKITQQPLWNEQVYYLTSDMSTFDGHQHDSEKLALGQDFDLPGRQFLLVGSSVSWEPLWAALASPLPALWSTVGQASMSSVNPTPSSRGTQMLAPLNLVPSSWALRVRTHFSGAISPKTTTLKKPNGTMATQDPKGNPSQQKSLLHKTRSQKQKMLFSRSLYNSNKMLSIFLVSKSGTPTKKFERLIPMYIYFFLTWIKSLASKTKNWTCFVPTLPFAKKLRHAQRRFRTLPCPSSFILLINNEFSCSSERQICYNQVQFH